MKKSLIPIIVIFLSFSIYLSETAALGENAPQADAGLSAACSAGEWKCSEDAYTLHVCKNSKWEATACMAGSGMLCYNGACVQPTAYGSPKWPDAAGEPLATPSSLASKRTGFCWICERSNRKRKKSCWPRFRPSPDRCLRRC